jgi:hypothetical protein
MAKNSVTEYDLDPNNNTDIGGISIEGSDSVSNFDNALRTMMSHLKSAIPGDLISIFTDQWGYSSDVDINDSLIKNEVDFTASSGGFYPVQTISATYDGDSAIPLDFVGAPGGSVPVGVFAQHEQTGSNSANNAFTHSIAGYALNNAAGDNDVIAVSGRVRKKQVTDGIGDAAGVWGSAYQESTLDGGVMALEGHIYQNVAGTAAKDRLGPGGWSTSLHLYSSSTLSPATCGISIDSNAENFGYGFWNAIIIDKNAFSGNQITGTVGINGGSWDGSYAPEIGIKFGLAKSHIYATNDFKIGASGGVKIYGGIGAESGAAGLQLYAESGQNAYIDLFENGTFANNIGYLQDVGGSGTDALVLGDGGTTPISIARTGGKAYIGAGITSGKGWVFGASNANDGYLEGYRNSSSAADGVLDIYSDWGATKRNVLRVQSDGNVLNYNNSYGALSDRRLKENISDYSDCLERINKLNVVSYSMKADKRQKANQVGLIAQDVEKIFPEFVGQSDEGHKYIEYSKFVPVLLKAVQELSSNQKQQA